MCLTMFCNLIREYESVALGMKQDFRGAGYHVGQSKIAIGSGGFRQRILKGTQTKLKYVPEQDTDFIFVQLLRK